jgi:hypothetical protein
MTPIGALAGRGRRLAALSGVTLLASMVLVVGTHVLGSRDPGLVALLVPVLFLSCLVALGEVGAACAPGRMARWADVPSVTWSWVVIVLVLVALASGLAVTVAFR